MQPAQHDQLVAFVKYHLLAGRISMDDMLDTNGSIVTLCGSKVIVKGIDTKAMVNDANIIRSDTSASNGVSSLAGHGADSAAVKKSAKPSRSAAGWGYCGVYKNSRARGTEAINIATSMDIGPPSAGSR